MKVWVGLIMNWVNTLYDHTKVFLKVLKNVMSV